MRNLSATLGVSLAFQDSYTMNVTMAAIAIFRPHAVASIMTKPNGSGQSIERVTAQFRSRSAPVSQETTLGPTVQLLCASGGV